MANGEKLINHGSVVAMGFTGETTNKNFIYLISANQYYLPSVCVSSSLTAANLQDAGVAVANWATMANGTFGQLWGFWTYKAAEAGAVKIGVQDVDNIIIVGSLLNVGTAFVLGIAAAADK